MVDYFGGLGYPDDVGGFAVFKVGFWGGKDKGVEFHGV